nr:hypothetical protein [Tanacetum cinerariifolium]
VLVDGPASLLQTSVNSVQHYFVSRVGWPVLELAARNYLQMKDGRQLIMSGNNYQAELLKYFGDCPAAVQAIDAFKTSALVGVVQAYNRQCATPPRAGIEYQSQNHGSKVGYALASLLTRIGRRGVLATPAGVFNAQVDNQIDIVEVRVGGRYFWADNRRGQHLFVGTGITVAGALGDYQPTLAYYDANQKRVAQDYVPDAYPHSTLLPYLEVGVQQGRLTLALDGRIEAKKETS